MAEEQQQPVQEQIVRFFIRIFQGRKYNEDSVVFQFSMPINLAIRLFLKKVISYDADFTKINTLNQKKWSW